MSQCLPYGGIKLLSQEEIKNFDVDSISGNTSDGYILEVHLEYPVELYKLYDDYPLAPENLEISNDMLPPTADKYGIKAGGVKKLIPNLGHKSKYGVHYRNFHLYLSLGMKLTKVHRILKFKQFDWMKIYIDFNTEKRKKAVHSFEKKNLS